MTLAPVNPDLEEKYLQCIQEDSVDLLHVNKPVEFLEEFLWYNAREVLDGPAPAYHYAHQFLLSCTDWVSHNPVESLRIAVKWIRWSTLYLNATYTDGGLGDDAESDDEPPELDWDSGDEGVADCEEPATLHYPDRECWGDILEHMHRLDGRNQGWPID